MKKPSFGETYIEINFYDVLDYLESKRPGARNRLNGGLWEVSNDSHFVPDILDWNEKDWDNYELSHGKWSKGTKEDIKLLLEEFPEFKHTKVLFWVSW